MLLHQVAAGRVQVMVWSKWKHRGLTACPGHPVPASRLCCWLGLPSRHWWWPKANVTGPGDNCGLQGSQLGECFQQGLWSHAAALGVQLCSCLPANSLLHSYISL